jgi:hypothetical protein
VKTAGVVADSGEQRMQQDIFQFWESVPGSALRHPADIRVLDRVEHTFDLQCLPTPFFGPLRTAEVVLLFLNPGLRDVDIQHAKTAAGQDLYRRQRDGLAPLPTRSEHESWWKWWRGRVGQLGYRQPDEARNSVAVLNILPYKSKDFRDPDIVAALPSCRNCLEWAQSHLFAQAEAKQRVVICLRSAARWGLKTGGEQGYLFAPQVTRGGHIVGDDIRARIQAAIQVVRCQRKT